MEVQAKLFDTSETDLLLKPRPAIDRSAVSIPSTSIEAAQTHEVCLLYSAFSRVWKKTTGNPLTWFLWGCFVYLYLLLFKWPDTPFFQSADATIYFESAKRMLAGQMVYRDFFEFLTPGTDLAYLALFRTFGVRAWVPNLTLIFLGVSITWLIVATANNVINEKDSFLAGLLFLTLAFRFFLNGTHHWFSVFATMAATAVLMKERSPARICCAGFLCAIAFFFTPARGLLAVLGLGVFLEWECRLRKKRLGRF